MYLAHYTQWDQEKCSLNGGVHVMEYLLQKVLLYIRDYSMKIFKIFEKFSEKTNKLWKDFKKILRNFKLNYLKNMKHILENF